MSRARCLRFEVLETRRLLSHAARVFAHHAAHAAAATPLVLNGTLTVDSKSTALSMNSDGSSTTSVPVAGQLGTLGQVRGVWTESTDAYGDSAGPDTIRLHNAQGTFVVAFNNQNNGHGHPIGHGAVNYQHPQQVHGGTGAYAHAVEHGTIQVTTNNNRSQVVSLTLASR